MSTMHTKQAAFVLLMLFTACSGTLWARDPEGELAWREVTGTGGAEVLDVGSAIGSVAWSSDSKLIALQTRHVDPENRKRWSIQLHDCGSGKLLETLTDTAEETLRVASKTQEPKFCARFSPEGKSVICTVWAETHPNQLAGGAIRKSHWSEIRRWDTAMGQEVQRLVAAPQEGLGLAFRSDLLCCEYSPAGQLIAAGGKLVGDYPIAGSHIGGEVCVWDVGSGKLKWSDRSTHTDIVYAVAFSPDGRILASGGIDKLIRLWDAETGKLLRTLYGAAWDGVRWLQFSRDGTKLASCGRGQEEEGRIRVWNVESGELVGTLSRTGSSCIALLPRGDLILATRMENMKEPMWRMRSWNMQGQTTGEVLPEQPGHAIAMCVSPDGKALLVATSEGSVYRCKLGE